MVHPVVIAIPMFLTFRTFRLVDTPADLASLRTDFELDFLARGLKPFSAAYELT